jgi:hypothetical protein
LKVTTGKEYWYSSEVTTIDPPTPRAQMGSARRAPGPELL